MQWFRNLTFATQRQRQFLEQMLSGCHKKRMMCLLKALHPTGCSFEIVCRLAKTSTETEQGTNISKLNLPDLSQGANNLSSDFVGNVQLGQ